MADKQTTEADPAQKWIQAIALYEREFKKWETRTEKILKRYRDDQRNSGSGAATCKFNVLWSNVQTAIPAVFSRLPKPDVSRRHRDTDPVGRVAALILERALEFEVDHYPDYAAAMRNCVQDRFLGGRGVAWVRYEPHIRAVEGSPDDGVQVTEDADEADNQDAELEAGEQQEEIEYECAPTDYVHWKDFGHSIARTWEEVTAVWRKVYMGREALVERFGEEMGKKIPLDTKPIEKKDSGSAETQYEAVIYEIWDKESGTALWLSKSLGKIVDEKPDPLELENFWPCPRPLFATLTSDSLVPVPDFVLYQDQANTLDVLADRIDSLIRALQVKGVYDASIPELQRLFTDANNSNSLIAVKNWLAFAEKQGLRGAIDLVDLTPIFNALKACYEAAEQQKQQIYELTGLADIIRGSTDPRETAMAQKLKGNFGSMRLRSMQSSVSKFAEELLQIKAQIMCHHFQPETLAMIGSVQTLTPADQQVAPQALQLLKSSTLRDFRIEVSADSMIQMDEAQEKEDRASFLESVGTFIQKGSQVPPEFAPLVAELLKFGVTGFKVGKQLEGTIDQFLDQLREQAKQPKQPKQDPEMVKIQAQAQQSQVEMQAKQQYDQFKANLDAQVEQSKQQAQAAENDRRLQMEAARDQQIAQLEAQTAQHDAALKAQLEQQRMDFERWRADLDARTRVAVAEIAANTTLQAEQLKAASAAARDQAIVDKTPATPAPTPDAKPKGPQEFIITHKREQPTQGAN